MNPIPCSHCAVNFMRKSIDPEAPKLCNSCVIRENIRCSEINKKGKKMDENNVNILIECPKEIQKEIEEICLNNNLTFSTYFLQLHNALNVDEIEKNQNPTKKEKGNKK